MFLSWIRHHGRSVDLANALGVPAVFVAVGRRGNPLTVPWRYALQAVRTIRVLTAERPAVLYVMAPPLPLVLIGLLYKAIRRVPLVVDAHTGAVVADGSRLRRRFAAATKMADVTVVTTEHLAALLRRRGVNVVVVHDPPYGDAAFEAAARPAAPGRPTLVMASSWYRDEPLETVRAAARLVPEIDLVVTGRPQGPLSDPAAWPDNVRLSGWLPDASYADLVGSATGLVALTTREMTMQRGAYEALILGKPAVVSDTIVLRGHFPAGVVFSRDDPVDLAVALTACARDAARLGNEMVELRAVRREEFAISLEALAGAVRR